MRYTIRPTLWEKLAAEERSLRWLGRKAQVDATFLSRLQNDKRQSVSGEYAARIAAVFDMTVADFFSPIATSQLSESGSSSEKRCCREVA